MQLKSIILYNSKGEVRNLEFKLGKVNIITGKSNTGKSALIDILDYCLGRSKFNVAEGKIRNTVEWYAIILQLSKSQILIAKPRPKDLNDSQSSVYLEVGAQIAIPRMEDLTPNTNDDALITYLSTVVGISPNIHVPDEGQTRDALEANFKHTKYYLFQKQNLIANHEVLFYRQSEPWQAQAIKDTLPYMLGAIKEDYLQLVNDYRDAKREYRRLSKDLQESGDLVSVISTTAEKLLIEGQGIGLVAQDASPETTNEVINLLKETKNWIPSQHVPMVADKLFELQSQFEGYHKEYHSINDKILAAEAFAKNASGYKSEVEEQLNRLESVHIYRDEDASEHTCPLCGNSLSEEFPHISTISSSLESLKGDLLAVEAEKPRLGEYIAELKTQREEIRVSIQSVEINIDSLLAERELSQQIKDVNTRIARVVGRISLFLESLTEMDEESKLRIEHREAKERVDYLAKQISPDEIEDKLTSILNLIASRMTELAKKLNLEHKDYAYRFDERTLTVIADRPGNPIPMQRMGGGENWLGCHLIALLALHKHFSEQGRPVPNFIVFDQPTQVYFPPDLYPANDGPIDSTMIGNNDLDAVNRMFELMFEFCEEIFPNFQIIVTEHANLHNEKFQEALVEEPWSDGKALIPESWF